MSKRWRLDSCDWVEASAQIRRQGLQRTPWPMDVSEHACSNQGRGMRPAWCYLFVLDGRCDHPNGSTKPARGTAGVILLSSWQRANVSEQKSRM